LSYTLTLGAPGMTIDESTGEVSWWPGAAHGGDHRIEIVVSDGFSSATQAYTMRVSAPTRNLRPVASLISPTDRTTVELGDVVLRWDMVDPEDDPTTVDVFLSDQPGLVDARSVAARVGAGIQARDYTASELRPGTVYHWTVLPSDAGGVGTVAGGAWSFRVELPRVNLAPVILGSCPAAVKVGESYTCGLDIRDPDNDTVSVTIEGAHGAAYDADGKIRWKPTRVGTYTLVVTARDDGANTSRSFTITVSPGSPPSATFGDPFSLLLLALVLTGAAGAFAAIRFLRSRPR